MANDSYICPECGTEVRVGADACPGCYPAKPWEHDGDLDGLDLDEPDADLFDYERFVAEELDSGTRPRGIQIVWAVVALLLIFALLAPLLYPLIVKW